MLARSKSTMAGYSCWESSLRCIQIFTIGYWWHPIWGHCLGSRHAVRWYYSKPRMVKGKESWEGEGGSAWTSRGCSPNSKSLAGEGRNGPEITFEFRFVGGDQGLRCLVCVVWKQRSCSKVKRSASSRLERLCGGVGRTRPLCGDLRGDGGFWRKLFLGVYEK